MHSMFVSSRKMTRIIRTTFGDSTITYGDGDIGDWENGHQGLLQGNTAGPDIRSTLSSVVFAISKQVFTLVGFAYVDNVT